MNKESSVFASALSTRATMRACTESNPRLTTELLDFSAMRFCAPILAVTFLFAPTGFVHAQDAQDAPAVQGSPLSEAERRELFNRVIANQRKNDEAQAIYERVERLETHKGPPGAPPEVKITRAVPAGTGVDHIPVGPDGKPTEQDAYRAALEKLEHSLVWASEDGRAQRDAYDKMAKKQKERSELLDATRTAFLYTYVTTEPRGDRMLTKYRMEPNPAYKSTSRATAIFAHVRGYVWIDQAAAQLARAEIEVTDDISVGGFLAKVYKGSHLMQERYEMAPGIWLPSFAQYDFDGRKLFVSFSIHDRTFYSQYRRIGPPKEALAAIRAELGKPSSTTADP
jgi:hypothetical protein